MRKGQVYFFVNDSMVRGEDENFPRVDLFLTKEEVYLIAEVPGVSDKALEVKILKERVEIRGVRHEPESCASATQFYKLESFYGTFERKIVLPCEVDPSQAQVKLKDGILEIRIPRHVPRIVEIPVE